jgi:hypothetical protein
MIVYYEEQDVLHFTRLLARAYEMIRDEPATPLARDMMLREIQKTLGWEGPPPVKAKPPTDQRDMRPVDSDWMS